MIDQSYIAKAVNDALGKDFYVTPFARKAVSPDDIIYVTMTLTRTHLFQSKKLTVKVWTYILRLQYVLKMKNI